MLEDLLLGAGPVEGDAADVEFKAEGPQRDPRPHGPGRVVPVADDEDHPGPAATRPPSLIGVAKLYSMSQGKWIHLFCLNSLTKVSTMGRPAGLAYRLAKYALGRSWRTAWAVRPVSTRSSISK